MPGRGIDQPFAPKILYDSVRALPDGMNAGVEPQSIPRTQAAFLRNTTVRGTFPTHRPSYRRITLSFADATAIGGATQAYFQAACYHKAITGVESLMAAVAGRLFQFAINGTTATVTELTTPALQQSSSAPQCWLWQAERFLIFNDGSSLPLFWDGTTIRRSKGITNLIVGTTNANFTTAGANTAIDIALAGPYLGPLGETITINSGGTNYAFVINSVTPNAGTSAFKIDLKNLWNGAGTARPAGTQLSLYTGYMGFTTGAATCASGAATVPVTNQQFASNKPVNVQWVTTGGQTLTFFGNISGLPTASTMSLTGLNNGAGLFTGTIPAGAFIRSVQGGETTQLIETTVSAFNDPTPGNTQAAVQVGSAYTNQIGLVVFVGPVDRTAVQFAITNYVVDSSVTYTAHATAVTGGITFNSGSSLILTTSELPAGRMAAYGRGRNWVALTDGKHFIASDIVDGSSGTAAYDGEDAVLSVTENLFLNGGGQFTVPGQAGDIRAMIFTSQLDTSQGQGPLSVLTPKIVFTCDAPVDRTTWQNLTNPILTESIKANGGLSHYGTFNVNSDTLYRAIDGIRSQIIGRRDFDKWGNVPCSREVDFINADNPQLLNFINGVEFDNRALMTTGPQAANLGVYQTGIIALNNDPISSLQGKAPSTFDGLWDAPSGGVLQLVTGDFAGQTRCFAFCLASDRTSIELWEIMRTDDPLFQDDSGPIVWEIESAALNFYEADPRKRDFLTMTDGEIRVDMLGKTYGRNGSPITVEHQVFFEAFYKGDQAPDWIPWYSFTQTYDPNANDPGFRPSLGLGEPDPLPADVVNDSPQRDATTYQFKLRVTGHCRLLNTRLKAHSTATPDLAAPAKST